MAAVRGGRLEKASGEMRRSAEEMEKIAWSIGVEEGEPLGIFVRSQRAILLRMADFLDDAVAAVQESLDGVGAKVAAVEKLGQVEIEKAAELVKAGAVAMKLGEQALRSADIEYDKAIMRHMQGLKPLIVEEIKKWTVLKERERSFQTRAKWAAAASLLTMVVAGSGYAYRQWEDKNAAAVLDACSRRMVVAENGHHVCSVEFP